MASLFQTEGHLTIEKVNYNPQKGRLEEIGGKYTYCNFLPLSKYLTLCVWQVKLPLKPMCGPYCGPSGGKRLQIEDAGKKCI